MLSESETPKGRNIVPRGGPAYIIDGSRGPFPATSAVDGGGTQVESLQPAPGYRDLLKIAWRRKGWFLLGLSLSLLALPYYFLRVPVYRTDVQIFVAQKSNTLPLTVSEARLGSAEIGIGAHEAIIKSPLVVGRAIDQGNLQALPVFAGRDDVAGVIMDQLTVLHDSKDRSLHAASNVVELSYRGSQPEECAAVLAAVIASYQQFLDESRLKDSNDAQQLLSKWHQDVQAQLTEKEAAYRKLSQKSSLIGKGSDKKNFSQDRLATLETKVLNCVIRRTEVQQQLAAIEAAKKAGRSHEVLVDLVAKWTNSKIATEANVSSPSLELQRQLIPLLIQEQALAKQFGDGHPDVMAARAKIRTTRQLLLGPSGDKNDDSWAPADPVELYTQCLQEDLRSVTALEANFVALFATEQEKAKEANEEIEALEKLNTEIKSAQDLEKQIAKRLEGFQLVKDPGGCYAQVIAPPALGTRVAPNPKIIFPTALILGFLAGCSLVYVAEVRDTRYRNPEEVRLGLGLPVVGHIPLLRLNGVASPTMGGNGMVLDPTLYAHHSPQSLEAETCRSVRTALCFATHGEGHKVIMVTSPDVGDGKTMLTANLAVSMAQSGKQVVVVDADFRRPRLHKLFGVSAKIGLVSAIAGEAELVECVQHNVLPGLSVLPCGPIPANPAELLTSPRFKEMLDSLRDRYDAVLVDTSPLLAVTDPCVVAAHADAVLLTLRASKANRPQAERAKELLNALQVPVLGVVLNAVSDKDAFGRYFYEQYRYEYSPSPEELAGSNDRADGSANANGASEKDHPKAEDPARAEPRPKSGRPRSRRGK